MMKVKIILQAVVLLCTALACREPVPDAQLSSQESPTAAQAEGENSIGVKSNSKAWSVSLVEDTDTSNESESTPEQGSSLSFYLQEASSTQEAQSVKPKQLTPKAKTFADTFKLRLVDISATGTFLSLYPNDQTDLKQKGCFQAIYDHKLEAFLIDRERSVEALILFAEHQPVILFSGVICTNSSGKIDQIKNVGSFSTKQHGLKNMLALFIARGLQFDPKQLEQHEGFQLNSAAMSEALARKAELPGTGKKPPGLEGKKPPLRKPHPDKNQELGLPAQPPPQATKDLETSSFDLQVPGGSTLKVQGVVPTQKASLIGIPDPRDPKLITAAEIVLPIKSKPELKSIFGKRKPAAEGAGFTNQYRNRTEKGVLGSGRKYELSPIIAEGGFGYIRPLRIFDLNGRKKSDGSPLTSNFAVKVFESENSQGFKAWQKNQVHRKEVGKHKNIVDEYVLLIDAKGRPMVVSELLHEAPDISILAKNQAYRRQVMSGVIDGFAHIHSKNMVYWDFKPENYLITAPKSAKAKLIDTDGISPNTLESAQNGFYSLSYASPEHILLKQAGRDAADLSQLDWKKSDVYSLGVTMLESRMGVSATEYLKKFSEPFNSGLDAERLVIKIQQDPKFKSDPELQLLNRMLDPDWSTRPGIQEVSDTWKTCCRR